MVKQKILILTFNLLSRGRASEGPAAAAQQGFPWGRRLFRHLLPQQALSQAGRGKPENRGDINRRCMPLVTRYRIIYFSLPLLLTF